MSISFSVFKPKFKKTIADAVFQEVTSGTAIYYHWFGKENLWTDFLSPFIGSSASDIPGQPSNNFRYDLHVRRDILTCKKIKPSDVSYVVKRIDWVSGTVYDMYDDAIETVEGYGYAPSYSGAVTLEDSLFYVMTPEYKVYKCIWNNQDSPSTIMPTSTSTSVITTADGYKWKFMYLIPVSLRNRFLTPEWMPITTALKSKNYSGGEISRIAIQNGGGGYDPNNTNAVITGDGYKEYNPYIITDIQVVTRLEEEGFTGGKGYLKLAGFFVAGKQYVIVDPGTTDFTLIGSANNEVGTVFTATGVGSGTGSAHLYAEIEISDPFVSAVWWTEGAPVDTGTYLKYQDGANINFYVVVSGNNVGDIPPTFSDVVAGKGATQSFTSGGGNVTLRYVGRKARAMAAMSEDKDSVAGVEILDAGIGYFDTPIITVTPPEDKDSNFEPSYSGDVLGNIIYYQGRYYEVSLEGLTSPVDGPTHLDGAAYNGTAQFIYKGEDPVFKPIIEKTNAEIELIISPTKDNIFKIDVTYGGAKYTEVPDVTIDAPSIGSTATATAVVGTGDNAGTITAIIVNNQGNGYTTVPDVTVDTPKLTFNGNSDVSTVNHWITYTNHKFETGDAVVYTNGTSSITGLTDGETYYIRKIDANTIRLSSTLTNAQSGVVIEIEAVASDDPEHVLQLVSNSTSALAIAALGTGGEIVDFVITDAGVGYTNANIQIVDNDGNELDGGAILIADFSEGDVETLQADVELLAVPGAIETFKIVNGGNGYAVATVEILGDGSGASAIATCEGGKVKHVEIVNAGIGYTWTDVIITGNAGASGAEVRAIMTPLGGHGSNAIDELNAHSLSFYTSISRDINQGLEVTNDYRKVGLVRNLKQFGSNRRFSEDVGSGCVLVTGKYNPAQLLQDMLLLKDGYKKYRIVDFTDVNAEGEGQILLSVFNNFPLYSGDIIVTDPTNNGKVPDTPLVPINIVVKDVIERTIDQFSGDFLFFSVRESYAPTQDQIVTVRTTLTI